jgi:hypothetical protein
MKELYYKSKLSTIAIITLLAISAILVALPAATAQEPIHDETAVFLGAIPNPVGKGQIVLLHLGIFQALGHVSHYWADLTITVTKPDGTTETLGPVDTDSTGGTGLTYTPDQVGTYLMQSHFPEQVLQWTYYSYDTGEMFMEGTIMEASDSEVVELVVQEEAIPYYPGHSLPSEYWTRPIDAQLREWYTIAGQWHGMGNPNLLAPYNDAPEAPHILWAKQLSTGGLMGGKTGNVGAETGDAYEGKWPSPVILNGILYYNRYESIPPLFEQRGIVAVDLHTGEELWFRNNTQLSFGQTFAFQCFNYHGAYSYLWDTATTANRWDAYDPFNGEWVYGIENISGAFGMFGGVSGFGPSGEILLPVIGAGWLAMWNSTVCGQQRSLDIGSWEEEMVSTVLDGNQGYQWNVSIPSVPGAVGMFGGPPVPTISHMADDRVMGYALSPDKTELSVWGLSIAKGDEGRLLFNKTWDTPSSWSDGKLAIQFAGGTDYGEGGVFAFWAKEQRKFYGFSFDTGEYKWVTDAEIYLDAYGWAKMEHEWLFTDKYLYSCGCGGIIYCRSLETGETVWTYEADDPYQEYLFTNNWWQRTLFISDGKIYTAHTEHSSLNPLPRGAPMLCLDAETGDLVWRADGLMRTTHWGGRGIIGDSIIAMMDTYSQMVVAIGKGPSTTTVTVPDTGVPVGSSVMIKGSVMDVSPGTESPELQLRFPNGVPAVSDDSMVGWMKYVYKQFEKPEDATGVEVTIEVINPNGEYENLGTTTTDTSGNYGFHWKPTMEGKYMILATFYGTNSYYPSISTTYLAVDAAPEDVPSAEEIADTTASKLPTASGIADETIGKLPAYLTIDLVILIVAAVGVVIGIIAYMALRKRQ